MVVEEVASNLLIELGKIGLWVQAIGLVITLWIVFQLIALIVNRKKRKALYRIEERLTRIEKKIDGIVKKR